MMNKVEDFQLEKIYIENPVISNIEDTAIFSNDENKPTGHVGALSSN